jgi:D-arabinose 1-dehydrogenase-like Zn-dependent alcohol dehydrogenase
MPVSFITLIMTGTKIVGSGAASPGTMRSMLSFAAKNNVEPQIEKFSLTQKGVHDAMEKLNEGKIRYRGVLVAE